MYLLRGRGPRSRHFIHETIEHFLASSLSSYVIEYDRVSLKQAAEVLHATIDDTFLAENRSKVDEQKAGASRQCYRILAGSIRACAYASQLHRP